MMSTLDIDSMRALTVIAESGGITRAAKRLNLSQSAVSHKMKRLEGKLNRILFARSDGKLVFSADGEKLLDYARRLVRLHDEACASFHQSDLSGELRLGITEDVSAPGMAQILSSFSTSFPNVTLTSRVAHTPELTRWLQAGEIDMALIEVFESDLKATDQVLGQQQIAWLQAEDFVLDQTRPIPFVTYHRDCFYKAWLEQRHPGGRRMDPRGLRMETEVLPQPPSIQHVARFSTGISTRQMEKLLEAIKTELVTE